MASTMSHLVFILASVVAGGRFADGLSGQRVLKALRHQDLDLVDVNFDWLDSPTISKIVRHQLGVIYHKFISQADRGVLNDDEKLAQYAQKLKLHFEKVKDQTKFRLRNKGPTKSRKPRDSQHKPIDRRKMLNRKYLRS